jgi:hypothetical protein
MAIFVMPGKIFLAGEPVKAWQPLFPVNTGHGAFDHGFLNEVFGTTFGFDDFGFLGFLIQPENLRANLFATAAANALILIDVNSFFHLHHPFCRNRMSGRC